MLGYGNNVMFQKFHFELQPSSPPLISYSSIWLYQKFFKLCPAGWWVPSLVLTWSNLKECWRRLRSGGHFPKLGQIQTLGVTPGWTTNTPHFWGLETMMCQPQSTKISQKIQILTQHSLLQRLITWPAKCRQRWHQYPMIIPPSQLFLASLWSVRHTAWLDWQTSAQIFIHLGFVKRTILNGAWFLDHPHLWQTQIISRQNQIYAQAMLS